MFLSTRVKVKKNNIYYTKGKKYLFKTFKIILVTKLLYNEVGLNFGQKINNSMKPVPDPYNRSIV